jgi:hypothetical protein
MSSSLIVAGKLETQFMASKWTFRLPWKTTIKSVGSQFQPNMLLTG